MSVLLEFVQAGNDVERLREILATRVNPNERAADGRTALHFVASKTSTNRQDVENVLEMAHLLITSGADVNARNAEGRTPLVEAVRADNLRMVEFLLERNADVNQPDNEGNTPLHHVVVNFNSVDQERSNVRHIRKHIVKALAEYNCDLDRLNNDNKAPLLWAVENQDYWIVKELLKQNASVNARDNLNNSLMHYALNREVVNENIVLELVRYGCRFSDINHDNKTAMAVYLEKLESASDDELKTAKYVFKIFFFYGYMFEDHEINALRNIGEADRGKLPDYCQSCRRECLSLPFCKIGHGYTIYDLVLFALSYRNADDRHIPDAVFDKVLKKIFKGKFHFYFKFILSGISRPYLRGKFIETCKSVKNANVLFLNVDALYLLSSYLSHFDMFIMIVALSPPVKKHGCLPPVMCRK